MKILNVNMSLDPVSGGGTVERTIQISRYLSLAGIECAILTLDINLSRHTTDKLIEDGVKVISLRCMNKRFYIPAFEYHTIMKLVSDADVVHLMNHWTVINALVYAACRKLDKPYIVCPAGALPIFGRSAPLKKIYNLIVGKRIIKNARGLIAIPAAEGVQFEPYAILPEKITVIPNGVEPKDFSASDPARFRKKFNLPGKPLILFLGRLNPIKGPDLLLKAFSLAQDELLDYHLVFAGPDGGMLSELESLTAEFSLQDRVHFIGYIGGANKSQAYHAAELLVIPSRQEAMSIVALEAGISGTPVLMTDVCGFSQIEDVGGGIIVRPTVTDIEQGLMKLLKDSQNLIAKGEAMRQFVLKKYTWESIIKKYIGLFNRVIETD